LLRWRLIAAASILIPLFVLLYLDVAWNGGAPGIWLAPLGLAVSVGSALELCAMLRDKEIQPWRGTAVAGSAAVFATAYVPVVWKLFGNYPSDCPVGKMGWIVLVTSAVVLFTFMVEMHHYQAPGKSLMRIALTVATVLYAGLLPAFLVLLRTWKSNGIGISAFLSMVMITKLSDTGAYFTGRALGKHKLIPRISPGKTVEGSIGGFAAAIVASWIFFTFVAGYFDQHLVRPPDWWRWLGYGFLVCGAGMLGDLAESLIKRDLGCKDSSTWLPGLGGILDIVDSLLFAAPVAYACWLMSLIG